MHVSLPRRFHRVGRSMSYLLWLGFGVLAVIPWQLLCGQDQPAKPIVERKADNQGQDWDDSADNLTVEAKPSVNRSRSDSLRPVTSTTPSLIFRAQNGPMGLDPLQMTPIPVNPQQRGPEIEDPGFLSSDLITGRSGQAIGNLFRVGGFTGPAVGRRVSIFPIEWMPYSLVDNNLFFADIRAFKGATDTWGANFGGGYRRYIPAVDRIFGVNAFFDYDTTSSATFRQVGFGVESLGSQYDIRANAYLPTGASAQQLAIVNVDGTQQFVGHNLLVNQQRTIANALHGFDGEIGIPLPGPMAQRHDVRVFGGGYWYEGTEISAFGGWKTRIQANVIPSVSLQLEVTNDQQFKTNVVFGGSWSYGGFRQTPDQPKTQYDRMTTPVIRNYNIIVGITEKFDYGVEVINPATNQPYFIEHVDSNATTAGDGTVEHPFQQFGSAQSSTAHDIIFVHANSVFNGIGVALEQNVRVLGEASGIEHTVATLDPNSNASLGNFLLLPHPTPIPAGSTSTSRPMFLNAPGNGVTLANNSEFSGFQVGYNDPLLGPTGGAAAIGIFGDGVRDVVIRQTDVTDSGAQAVFLRNTLGTITFQGDTINDSRDVTQTTFSVSGTQGTILFTSDPLSDLKNSAGQIIPTPGVINNVVGTGGRALVVDSTARNSVVNFTGSTVNDTAGNGILITNDAGTVILGNANIKNGLDKGVYIFNDSGLIQSAGTITVDGAVGDSIVIEQLLSGGQVQFNGTGAGAFDVNVLNRQGRGVYLHNNVGNVIFSTGVSVAGNGLPAAIEYQGSSGDVTFNNIRINGDPNGLLGGPGILIGTNDPGVDNTGRFTVNGNTAINNVKGTGIEIHYDRSTVTFASALNTGTTTIDGRGGRAIDIFSNYGPITFNGTTTVTNGRAVATTAVNIEQNQNIYNTAGNVIGGGAVRFNSLNVQNAGIANQTLDLGVVGVNIDNNPAAVNFNVLNIGNLVAAQSGTAFSVFNEGQGIGSSATGLTINSGTIRSLGGTAVDIQNSNINVRLTSVSSLASTTLSPLYGINLVDNRLINDNIPPKLDSFMFTVGSATSTSQINGGTIRGATIAGVRAIQTSTGGLFQTGGISLNNMTISTNRIGIFARNLEQLNVSNSNISNNLGGFTVDTGAGIDAGEIPRVDITASQFNFNGTNLLDHAIYLHTNTVLLQPPASAINNPTLGRYLWNISNNTNVGGFSGGFTSATGTGDLVRIEGSAPGGGDLEYNINTIPIQTFGVPLVFQFNNNTMTLGAAAAANQGVAGVAVDWTGQIDSVSRAISLTSSLSNNVFNMFGNNTAMSIQNATNVYTTNFLIEGNSVLGVGGGNVGLFVNNFSQTNLDIGTNLGNTFTFNTPAATGAGTPTDFGMYMSIQNPYAATDTTHTSILGISNNTITMTGGALNQGIVFPLLQAPASITIDNNNINITNAQPVLGQGIQFRAITKPTVYLIGNTNNIVSINGNGAGITQANWFSRLPAGSTSGTIIINGFRGP